MRALLGRDDVPVFLDMKAREMLAQARLAARASGFLCVPMFQDGADAVWFTWTGSRIQRTLSAFGEFFGGLKVDDKRIALVFEKTNANKVREIYSGFLSSSPDALALARRFQHRVREKYDVYLSDDLTAELFAREGIDLPGAIKSIREGGIGNEPNPLIPTQYLRGSSIESGIWSPELSVSIRPDCSCGSMRSPLTYGFWSSS